MKELAALEASLGGGTLGLAATCAGESVLYQAETLFPTASSIKIAIVEEVFRQGLDLAQPVRVTEADFVGGSGVLASLTPGVALPLGDLATLAITVSDNTASNLCLRAVGGPEAVNARLAAWGCTQTKVHRPIKFKLEESDPPHTATGTPADFLAILAQLGPETKKRMAQVSDTAMLPRLLGVNAYARDLRLAPPPFTVAHKPGAVSGVRNDVGFIEQNGKTLTVAVFTKGCPDPRWTVENAGCLAVARAVEQLVEHFFRG
ncbi:serine hydrolase [Armatimonas rosea]|uniref:Beta-lactamase class A n=1 Tax=Armatimonas rosea TaxID=685828 RepID=A0A7W9W5V5_ARMRO|nr:beta-lactamase class A [Armatimonas rosea]